MVKIVPTHVIGWIATCMNSGFHGGGRIDGVVTSLSRWGSIGDGQGLDI